MDYVTFNIPWCCHCWSGVGGKKAPLIYRSETDQERWDGRMRAAFAQWKRGLTERPILGLKWLKTMTTSTSLTTADMWCISCGTSKEVLWKLSWPHFLSHWNHHKVTPGTRLPMSHKGTVWGFILTSWLCSPLCKCEFSVGNTGLTNDKLNYRSDKSRYHKISCIFTNLALSTTLAKLEVFVFVCTCIWLCIVQECMCLGNGAKDSSVRLYGICQRTALRLRWQMARPQPGSSETIKREISGGLKWKSCCQRGGIRTDLSNLIRTGWQNNTKKCNTTESRTIVFMSH